jgi:hypothetical protein
MKCPRSGKILDLERFKTRQSILAQHSREATFLKNFASNRIRRHRRKATCLKITDPTERLNPPIGTAESTDEPRYDLGLNLRKRIRTPLTGLSGCDPANNHRGIRKRPTDCQSLNLKNSYRGVRAISLGAPVNSSCSKMQCAVKLIQ